MQYDIIFLVRLVLDTNVIVAGMRSPKGASAALLIRLLKRQASMLLTVSLAFEYEAICMLATHRLAAKASEQDVRNLLDSIIDVIEPVEVHYQWRPQLSDASDEMVLEAAVNGRADAIVTFNYKDFGAAPARFNVTVWTPGEALRRMQK